jgi:ribose transport system permease protein
MLGGEANLTNVTGRTSAAVAPIHRRFPAFDSHRMGVWILNAGLLCFLAIATPNFFNIANLQAVLNDASILGIGAAAMTLLIMAGAFDLSVSSTMGLAPVLALSLFGDSYGPLIMLASVLAGGLLGVVNGLIITRGNVAPFVATLGTLFVYGSLGAIATGGNAVFVTSPFLLELSTGTLVGTVPYSFLILLAVCALCSFMLHRLHIGRWIRAAGSNIRAAHVNGIDLQWVYLILFTLTGAVTGLAGIILSGYLASAIATQAPNYNLSVISAVVVGGTSLRGGQGSLVGTLLAAWLFAMVNNGLILFGVDSYWQYLAIGVVLVAALTLGAMVDSARRWRAAIRSARDRSTIPRARID